MNTLFKGQLLSSSAFVAASDLVKRANSSRFVSKRLLLSLIVFFPIGLVAVLSSSQHADATEAIIGLSRAGDPAQIKQLIVARALALEPGSTLALYDAPSTKEIASITIPNDPAKARPERKVEFIAPAMAVLNRYFAATPTAGAENLNAAPFFDAIGPKVTEHGPGVRILLVGNPWFTAPAGAFQKPEYVGGFPSDGLILSDHLHSPFGTSGLHDLEGATVDYCYVTNSSSGFINGDHKERVQRAWTLLIQQRGGQMTSFMDDLKGCFDRFSEDKPPEGRQFTVDPKDSTMLFFYKAKDTAPRIMDAPPVIAGPPGVVATAADMRSEAARFDKPAKTTPPSTRTGTAWIGIQWQDPIDLDLYVRCEATSPFLFFAYGRSGEGHHNGDHRFGTGKEFESVNLTNPCQDISQAQIYINYFSGSVRASPKGLFAIEFDNGLFKTNFEIPAHSGNGAHDFNPAGGMGAPYWVKIDLASVLHLNGSAAAVRARTRSTK